jgi:hypothetical protein
LHYARLWNETRVARSYDDSIFVWIPKNAGSSVHAMLRPHGLVKLKTLSTISAFFRNAGRVTFGHMTLASLVERKLVKQDFVDGAYRFAVVRDPYARAISLFSYLSDNAGFSRWRRKPTFGELMELLDAGFYDGVGPFNHRGLSQCNPQVEWLRDARPQSIFRMEEPAQMLRELAERWDLPALELPHENRSVRTAPNLTLKERGLVERVYRADFEELGYPKL